jgi:hypothetical protein
MAATGTCENCRCEHLLDDGRHVALHVRWPGTAVEQVCRGSGKLCSEVRAQNAEKSRALRLARIDRMRADAEVAHDAIATGHPFPAYLILTLRAAALQEYRIKFPKARIRRLWFVVPQGRRRGSVWASPKGDVYCTLCRELLLQKVDRGPDYTERTREHTTLCALRRVAKLAEYVGPPVLRMPADALPERAEVG